VLQTLDVGTFYTSGIGDALIDAKKFPREITSYLISERKLLEEVVRKFRLVIEAGCMNGRYLKWVLERDKYYIGMDIVGRYITEAKEKAALLNLDPTKYEFICEGAEKVHTILVKTKINKLKEDEVLIFFPFNSFGNIENIEEVFVSLKNAKMNFFISSYKTDKFSIERRKKYYRNCGYKDIILLEEDNGIRFKSREGLNTVAYFSDWLIQEFSRIGIKIKTYNLNKIGIAFISLL
jgi:hypothetical protein